MLSSALAFLLLATAPATATAPDTIEASSGQLVTYIAPTAVAPGDDLLIQTVIQNTGTDTWWGINWPDWRPAYNIEITRSWARSDTLVENRFNDVLPGQRDTHVTTIYPWDLPAANGKYILHLATYAQPGGPGGHAADVAPMAGSPRIFGVRISPQAPRSIIALAGDNGAVVPAGLVSRPNGGDCTLAARPADGYAVDTWTHYEYGSYYDDILQVGGAGLKLANIRRSMAVRVSFRPLISIYTAHDFDRDGKADLNVYSPLETRWYVLCSSNNALRTSANGIWDRDFSLVPGDYDGDGAADYGIFSGGIWDVRTGVGSNIWQSWGWDGAFPVQADYDGDRKTDVAVFDPARAYWYIIYSSDQQVVSGGWGWPGTRPVPRDYDGDRRADLAVFDPLTGNWFILGSAQGRMATCNWGWPGVRPVPADYDGDGKADVAVFDPSAGNWYILRSSDGRPYILNWGWNGTVPLPADYDGDGKADMAVFDPNAGNWYILRSSNQSIILRNWGWSQTIPGP